MKNRRGAEEEGIVTGTMARTGQSDGGLDRGATRGEEEQMKAVRGVMRSGPRHPTGQ